MQEEAAVLGMRSVLRRMALEIPASVCAAYHCLTFMSLLFQVQQGAVIGIHSKQ